MMQRAATTSAAVMAVNRHHRQRGRSVVHPKVQEGVAPTDKEVEAGTANNSIGLYVCELEQRT